MKTFITKILLTLIIGFSLFSADAQQSKSLADFNKIEAGELFQIQFFHADRNSIFIETNNENDVLTDVKNGTLHLKSNFKAAVSWKVKIYFKELHELTLYGIATADCKDTLLVSSFTEKLSGSAKSNLILQCDTLKIESEEVAQAKISGTSTSAYYALEGSSKLNAQDLISKNVTIKTEGISTASINVTDFLSAHSEGISHIVFAGRPVNKSISIDELATIKDKTSGDDFSNEIAKGITKDGDTTRIKIFKKRFMIIGDKKKNNDEKTDTNAKRKMKRVWSGFELGVNGFTTPQMNLTFNDNYKFLNTKVGESWFFGLNLFEWDGQLIRNKLALTSGLGMQWSNIHFSGNDVLIPYVDSLASGKSSTNLSLNKLFTYDLTAPFLIKFAPGSKKDSKGGFHIAAGVIVHYITTASVVTETTANGYFQRVVMNDNFNINPFRVDATIRAGYSHIKFFANYSLTPYFNTSVAPDVRLFAAGLTLVGF